MHLVEKQNRLPARGRPDLLGLRNRRPDVLDARHDRRQRYEVRIGGRRDDARNRGLAGSRRAPEYHRVWATGFDRPAQRPAFADEVRLPCDVGELDGPHAIGKRPLYLAVVLEQIPQTVPPGFPRGSPCPRGKPELDALTPAAHAQPCNGKARQYPRCVRNEVKPLGGPVAHRTLKQLDQGTEGK